MERLPRRRMYLAKRQCTAGRQSRLHSSPLQPQTHPATCQRRHCHALRPTACRQTHSDVRRRHLRRPGAVVSQAAADRGRGATVVVAGEKAGSKYAGKNGYPCVSDAAIAEMRAADFRRRGRSRRLHARQAAARSAKCCSWCAISPPPASWSPPSATAAGFRSRPASIAACASPARRASRTTWSTPAPSGKTPPSSSTATSSPAASRTICPTSAGGFCRCWRLSWGPMSSPISPSHPRRGERRPASSSDAPLAADSPARECRDHGGLGGSRRQDSRFTSWKITGFEPSPFEAEFGRHYRRSFIRGAIFPRSEERLVARRDSHSADPADAV